MTYIKWKDEVESYLVNLSYEERQKIFSYFSEIYADKRDAGKSEEQIIEEFGTPYDVARRILDGSGDGAGDAGVSGSTLAPVTAEPHGNVKREHAESEPTKSETTTREKPQRTGTAPVPDRAQKHGKHIGLKIFIGVFIIFILAGLSLLIAMLIMTDGKLRVDYEVENFTAQHECSSLDLEMYAGKMNVTFIDTGNETGRVEIEYPTSDHFGYRVVENNGLIRLTRKSAVGFWFGWQKIPDITVKIPRGTPVNLDVDMSAGVTDIEGGDFKNIDIDMSAGTLTVGRVSCTNFAVDMSAGTMTSGHVSCTNFTVDMSAGDITVDGVTSAYTCEVDLSAGDAHLDTVKCDRIDIDLSAGYASLTVDGKASEYNITVDKSAGSCSVTTQKVPGSTKHLTIGISAGEVDVDFTH